MLRFTALAFATLALLPVAQAHEGQSQIRQVMLNLETPDRAAFDAVGAAALPYCKALSTSLQRMGGDKPFERYVIETDCSQVTTPADAEALRTAVIKAMGKSDGRLAVHVMWGSPSPLMSTDKPADKAKPHAH